MIKKKTWIEVIRKSMDVRDLNKNIFFLLINKDILLNRNKLEKNYSYGRFGMIFYWFM